VRLSPDASECPVRLDDGEVNTVQSDSVVACNIGYYIMYCMLGCYYMAPWFTAVKRMRRFFYYDRYFAHHDKDVHDF